jgi:hypothetical protein
VTYNDVTYIITRFDSVVAVSRIVSESSSTVWDTGSRRNVIVLVHFALDSIIARHVAVAPVVACSFRFLQDGSGNILLAVTRS